MGESDISSKVVAVADGVMAIAQVPGAQEVWEPLLRSLLKVQDEQAEAIARIDHTVQRLIDGPWETARCYLEEAALPETTAEQREEKLRNASAALHQAVPLQPEATLQRAYACLNLAFVEQLLGEPGASTLQAHRALEAAAACLTKELEEVKKKAKSSRNRHVALLGPPGLLFGPSVGSEGDQFRSVWHEYEQIEAVAHVLCGGADPAVGQCSEQIETKITELKLGKTVKKLTAAKH